MYVCNICMYVCMYSPCTYWIPEFKALKSQLMKAFIALNETINVRTRQSNYKPKKRTPNSKLKINRILGPMSKNFKLKCDVNVVLGTSAECAIHHASYYCSTTHSEVSEFGEDCAYFGWWIASVFLDISCGWCHCQIEQKTGGIHSRHFTPRDHKQNYIIGSNKRLISQEVDWSEFKFSSWKFSLVTPPPPLSKF